MKTTVALILLTVIAGAAHAKGSGATAPDKLWMTDFAAFVNRNPGHWVMANSSAIGPSLSAEEAIDAARRDAARQIFERMQARIGQSVDGEWLRRRIAVALQDDDWIADRQVNSIERPYGTIWSASLLIDAAPDAMDGLSRQMQRRVARERVKSAAAIGLSGALVLGVGLAYGILNWLTRGYFRVRLAAASLLVTAAGILGIVLVL